MAKGTLKISGADAFLATDIAAGAVDTAELAADAVTGAKIADDAIDSEHYADGSIDNAHIADDAIDSEHYADGSIDTAHIGDLQVTTAKIAADAITTAKIADSPTLVTPDIGTPTAGVVTNFSGVLPSAVTGGSGLDNLSRINFYEQWYLTTTFTGTDLAMDGWTNKMNEGTGTMSESSGYWTFPSTGYYYIEMLFSWNNGNANTTEAGWVEGIMSTRISSSNTIVQYVYQQLMNSSTTDYSTGVGTYIYDVTNTGTHLFFVGAQSHTTVATVGSISSSTITFLRLGDT